MYVCIYIYTDFVVNLIALILYHNVFIIFVVVVVVVVNVLISVSYDVPLCTVHTMYSTSRLQAQDDFISYQV